MISHSSVGEAFSAAASAMAADHNVVDIAASLLSDCVAILPAASAAIMVTQGEELVLLHSTSHRATQIEMLQIQSEQGPCVESIAGNLVVTETGPDALVARWHSVGEAIVRAGYAHVSAFPMRWHDRVVGGFNVFRAESEEMSESDSAIAQGFANLATLALVQPSNIPLERLTARISEAVQARSVIEQAKGVLAEVHGVDLGRAYELLLDEVGVDGRSITSVAASIVRAQHA
jgi:hypothetical protein